MPHVKITVDDLGISVDIDGVLVPGVQAVGFNAEKGQDDEVTLVLSPNTSVEIDSNASNLHFATKR